MVRAFGAKAESSVALLICGLHQLSRTRCSRINAAVTAAALHLVRLPDKRARHHTRAFGQNNTVVYRGWMTTLEEYKALARAISQCKQLRLRTPSTLPPITCRCIRS